MAQFSQPTQSGSSRQLVGVTARLGKALDSQNAKQGEAVQAKLDRTVKVTEDMKLPRGTELLGTIAAVEPSLNGGPSSMSLRFDQAKMKDGKTVPVKVTVIAAYPSDENLEATYGNETMGSAPRHVQGQDKFDQEPGLLSKVSMTSRVSGHNSATFSRKDGAVSLRAGTFLQVGISPLESNGVSSAGL
ncbi:MAG: hypothetical protein WA891_17040 [Acidobacteriaceae bacterium]